MKIGCVKEIKNNEFRVGLTPDNVRAYVAAGHHVYMEAGAGLGSGFQDTEYVQAGASLLDNAADIWQLVDMMIKVKEPLPEEYPLFREGLILYTYLHLAADKEQMDALLKGKVKAVAYETIQETDGSLPCLAPMSQMPAAFPSRKAPNTLKSASAAKASSWPVCPAPRKPTW